MKIILQYLQNLGLLLNKAVCTLAGKDPRMTISAVCYLHEWNWAVRIINRIYRNPQHCWEAAQGWDDPRIMDRSLW